jgi:hypothetical protein
MNVCKEIKERLKLKLKELKLLMEPKKNVKL